ncbi:hypothetical protein ACFVTC_12020 [Streptomyces sp. NPDC057950]|uniref:hypothetical protein n=1 Tax=Streptomyces sp. NPDC057950 TaxID=3346288 RepID=UPI0036ED439F
MRLSFPTGHAREARQALAAAVGRKQEAQATVPHPTREPISPCGPEGHVRERVEAFRGAGADMLDVIPVGVRYRAGRPGPSRAGSRRGHA